MAVLTAGSCCDVPQGPRPSRSYPALARCSAPSSWSDRRRAASPPLASSRLGRAHPSHRPIRHVELYAELRPRPPGDAIIPEGVRCCGHCGAASPFRCCAAASPANPWPPSGTRFSSSGGPSSCSHRLVGTTTGQRPKRRIGQNGVPGGLIPTGRFAGTWRPGYQTPQVKVTACLVRSPLSQSTSKVSSDSPALLEPQNQPSARASDASSGKLPASMTAES